MSSLERKSLHPPVTAGYLSSLGIFAGLDAEVTERLARELPVRQYEVGSTIIEEGAPAREMYVVLEGELEIVKRGRGDIDVRVALIGPGDWFGEMGVLDVQPRSASVRAVAPTTVLEIGAEAVDRLLYRQDLKSYALFVMNIARELSRRLRVADGILAQVVTTMADTYTRKGG